MMGISLNTLLQRVQSGEVAFSPDDESAAATVRFQPLANKLVHAGQIGLVEGVYTHRERSSGLDLYDFVGVKSGLTYSGIREISASSSN